MRRTDMSNINQQIAEAFADCDRETILNVPEAIREAREMYRNMKANYLATPFGSSEREMALAAMQELFSKKFRDDYDWGEAEHIKRHIAAVKKIHEARNARIAGKFIKAGIDSINVDNFKVVYGETFEGVWLIDGYRVSISVIFAGGYNIQKLHQRVLVNVKKAA